MLRARNADYPSRGQPCESGESLRDEQTCNAMCTPLPSRLAPGQLRRPTDTTTITASTTIVG